MKYCPNCKRDFEDGTVFCRWCEVDLVDSLGDIRDTIEEKLQEPNGDLVTVYTAFDVRQACRLEKVLQEAGIPVSVNEAKPLPEEDEEEEETVTKEAEEPKKGFFARLFAKEEKPIKKSSVLFGDEEILEETELFDIAVPAAVAEEATALLNKELGLSAEEEVATYEESEL